MATSSFLASFYFVSGAIIFFLGVMILRYSSRDIVGWATALVLFFAGIGPILGAIGVILENNLQQGTLLFKNVMGNFDYGWEFFFPSLVLFALVYPVRHRIWKYIRRYVFLLFVPHFFHLILVLFLLDRVNPENTFNFLANREIKFAPVQAFFVSSASVLNILTALLFKAHNTFFSLVNISYAAFSIALLRKSMKLELPPRVHRQMRVVVTGLGLCIVIYSLGKTVPFFLNLELDDNVVTAFINAALILGGGSIALAIVRHQFLDIRLIARKGIFYGAVVAIFATIYLLTIKQVTEFFYRFSGARFEFLETVLIIIFIIIFQPVFSRMEEWIDRLLAREEKSTRVRIRELSDELLSVIEVEDLKKKINDALGSVFTTKRVETVFCDEIFALKNDDPYAIEVVKLMIKVAEPMTRLDFMEAMGFLNLRGRTFLRPGKKAINEAVKTMPGIVRRFAGYKLIVPVLHEGACMAVLLLGEKEESDKYTMEEQALLSMLALQISASLSRIELLKEVVEKKVMEEELNIAKSIQMNLLPTSLPVIDRYELAGLSIASKQVGGDYYDFIHDDSHLAFVVADVSGKGVPASLLMASLQASLRSMMDRMNDPVAVIGRLNDVMCDITAPDKFATMFYGCIDIDRNEIKYSNAGHFFPVILRKNGKVEELDYSGLILGVSPGFEYECRKTRLEPGDSIIVTTDGVTEAENQQGELYGEERLHPFLATVRDHSADRIKDSIVEEVNRFSYPMGANDDMTIVVVKRNRL
ncbi:MAG: SpoIIE family protein phosphatase [Candidatus Krumholzibacteriota bacterium]|nr:SpoIIE family protein phosphatase [Candidatus Krumholzibacteriota bacterium]